MARLFTGIRFVRLFILFSLATVTTIVAVSSPSPVSASSGSLIGSVNFSQQCSSGLGVGLTFDGSNLWYSCFSSATDLYRADPKTGTVAIAYNIAGGLGSLAYDAKRNAIWAGWGGGNTGKVYLIHLDRNMNVVGTEVKFSAPADVVCGLDDGLAYDAQDDTLYVSDDCSQVIHHHKTDGTLINNIPWAGSGCYNSGVAIGGQLLFEGSDGCNHIWVVDKTTNEHKFDFPSPGTRDESLTCDTKTFSSIGKEVMWSKEAYNPMRAYAFEIPSGTCGVGGQAALYNFKQYDAPWNSQRLFNNSACGTVQQVGCALTSLADVLASYGINSLPDGETPVNPGTLNKYLSTIQPDCNMNWGIVAPKLGLGSAHVWLPPANPWTSNVAGVITMKQQLDSSLAAGQLAIAEVAAPGNGSSGIHFVVVYQPAGADYQIADPDTHAASPLLIQTYGIPLRIITFDKQVPKRTWVLRGRSPIQLLITDPLGRQTGVSGVAGTPVQNMPDSVYDPEPGLADDTGGSSLPPTVYFQQANQLDGTYIVQVVGTGTGPYHLDFGTFTAPGTITMQTIQGTALPGSLDIYLVTFSATSDQPAMIQRQVQIAIKPGADPAPINPSSQGVLPVGILSTPTFDATTVDFHSIRFGPSGASAVDQAADIEDVNGDGLPDMVLHFKTSQTGIVAGDTTACLVGQTASGVAITGCGKIVTVPAP